MDLTLDEYCRTLSNYAQEMIQEDREIRLKYDKDVPIYAVLYLMFRCGLIKEAVELSEQHSGDAPKLGQLIQNFNETSGNIEELYRSRAEQMLQEANDPSKSDIFKEALLIILTNDHT